MTPRVFWLHIDSFDAPKGAIWAVQTRGEYLTARAVDVRVRVDTVFRGRGARQPRAFLRGRGVVRKRGARITITES